MSSVTIDPVIVFMVFPEKHDSSSPTRRMSESGGVLNFGKPPRSILYAVTTAHEYTREHLLSKTSAPFCVILPLLCRMSESGGVSEYGANGNANLPKEHGLSSMSRELVWSLIT